MKILWTEPARMDLREIFLYISNDNPKAARVLLDTIKKRVELLKENPRLGRLGRVEGTYELVLAETRYIVPYRIKNQQIEILAVFHGSREWPDNFQTQ
ncbi:MAG: type II toxin-antitoxin system RelE/ParE family toxin [Methylococcaceae bacterium]|jgi:addiction module RelE/StbE family toxin